MTEDASLHHNPTDAGDDTIDLLQLFTLLVVQWRKFLAAAICTFVVCVIIIYTITPQFESTASLLPQTKESSSDLASFFSGRTPGDVFIGLLSSRTVVDEVIDRVGLMKVYKTDSHDIARTKLASNSTFTSGKDTLVTIRIRDKDAETAMRIGNAYLEALEHQREKMLADDASLHLHFFEQQISQEAEALSAAESELKAVEEHTGLVLPEAQATAGINAIANLRAQITNLQVQLASLLLGESEQNPEVKALRAQIGQLQGQERALESSSGQSGAGAAAAAGKLPQLSLDYARKLRAVKYHEALLTGLSNQYQAARLAEGNAGAPYVIVDHAIAPERKAWPPRVPFVLLAFVFSGIVGIVYVALALLWARLNADPVHSQQLESIRSSFRSHR